MPVSPEVVAVDSSAEMLDAARQRGLQRYGMMLMPPLISSTAYLI